jgi:hypothetical protein
MSLVKYELGFYIPEDGILHSDRRENPRSSIFLVPVRPDIISTASPRELWLCCEKPPSLHVACRFAE